VAKGKSKASTAVIAISAFVVLSVFSAFSMSAGAAGTAGAGSQNSPSSINTAYPVMENSIFAPIVSAKDAVAQAADIKMPQLAYQREELLLNGKWRYAPDENDEGESRGWHTANFNDASWKEMNVPSNFGVEDNSLWNFTKPVWFRCSFAAPQSMNGKYQRLTFEGVDYLAEVWLNGQKMGRHEGYFCPFQFDVTGKLTYGSENVLAVRVIAPIDPQIRDPMITTSAKTIPKGILNHHDCRPGATINAALSQTMHTGGIYRDVKIIATGAAKIDWIFITPTLSSDYKTAEITFQYFVTNYLSSDKEISVITIVDGANFSDQHKLSANVKLRPGANRFSLNMKIDNPKLWFPWDHPELGMPYLYSANTYLIDGNLCLDNATNRFGIREIRVGGQLDADNDRRLGPDAYHFYINGKKIYMKGSNYIPTEWMAVMDKEFCKRDAALIKGANMNMMRVHAHVSPPVLLDTFGEEGILVWQDFTLQWRYTDNTTFIDKTKRMIAEMTYLLYNHPSIAIWCTHNEPTWAFIGGTSWSDSLSQLGLDPSMLTDLTTDLTSTSDDKKLDNELYNVMTGIDKTRAVHKGSGYGNTHCYSGWYTGIFTDFYERLDAFTSEYGAQGVTYSMQKWMPEEYLWPPVDDEGNGYPWHYHDAQLSNQATYIGSADSYGIDSYGCFNEYAFASQLYQAELIKYVTEYYRTCKYAPTGGALSFQFLNWWQSVAWGIADYDRQPLLAYEYISKANEPVHICVKWKENVFGSGESINFPVYAINDFHRNFNANVEWKIVEETDSFIIRGERQSTSLDQAAANPRQDITEPDPITVCKGYGVPISEMASGSKTISLGMDSIADIGSIQFNAPAVSADEIRHFTLYLTLQTRDGIKSENWHHFIVVPDKDNFNPSEGLNQKPAFNLKVDVERFDGKPISGIKIDIIQKYGALSISGTTDKTGSYVLSNQIPDVYEIIVHTEKGEIVWSVNLLDNAVVTVVVPQEAPPAAHKKGFIPGFEVLALIGGLGIAAIVAKSGNKKRR